MKYFHLLTVLLLTTTVRAQVRTSTDFAITTDTQDSGGKETGSADYGMDASVGAVVGTSYEFTSPAGIQHGYIGQLYEITRIGFFVVTDPSEESSSQVICTYETDDNTQGTAPEGQVLWTIGSGPLTSINSAGIVTAGPVLQHTSATVRGIFRGQTGFLIITVRDTSPDNFGSYAGDGLPDAWQFEFFGADNPLAGPASDADHDGFDNRFEYNAGLDPADGTSNFVLEPDDTPALPAGRSFRFHPRLPGHRYLLESNTGLDPDLWSPVAGVLTADDGETRTLTDPAPHPLRGFYRIRVSLE